MTSFKEKLKKLVLNKIFLITLFIVLSIIFALGFNNVTRELQNIDNGLIAFLTFSSISFVLGTFLYTSDKDRVNNPQLIFRFILAGILIILAFSLAGLVGDVKADTRIMAFFSFDILSNIGIVLTHILSFLNFLGLFIFFYSLLELIYYLRNENKPFSEWKIIWILIGVSIVAYIILSGLIFPLNPPKLEVHDINSTNETLLHISDKDWFVTIDLNEYIELPRVDYSPSRFFLRYKSPLFVSAFAQKVPVGTTPQKCLNFYKQIIKTDSRNTYQNFNETEWKGDLLLTYDMTNSSTGIKSIDYFDYYDGYCFIFHIVTDSRDENLNKTYELLDSIKLLPYGYYIK